MHTSEELDREERRYIQIFVLLGILTALEIAVIYAPITHSIIVAMLVLLAATKAALVALYYMHLAVEKRTLMYIALTPAVLCVWLLLMLTPDLSSVRRLWAQQTPLPAGSHESHHE